MDTKVIPIEKNDLSSGRKLLTQIMKHKEIYLILLPVVAWYVIFAYMPIFGLSLAFKTYRPRSGILGSPWVGLQNYVHVFRDPAFLASVFRTLQINIGRLVFQFPVPILLAIIINEVRIGKSKRILQTIYTFPHFLSWVIVASIMTNVLGINGMVNSLVRLFGGDTINFLGSTRNFLPLIYLSEIWKSSGWSAIIYLAAISGIDTEQYEAAEIDGASRLQRVVRITVPGIKNTVIVMFVLAVGYVMSAGFDQLFNISNPATFRVAETLDMYIYRITFRNASDFSFSAAVSLFRGAVNFLFLLAADRLTKRISGTGLFG